MRRPSLRWLLLAPILATVTLGFVSFAAYVRHSVQNDLVAGVDDELTRAERTTRTATTGPNDGADRAPGSQADDIDPPVKLVITPRGELLQRTGRDNPFSTADLTTIAGFRNGDHTFEQPAYRIRTTTRLDGTTAVTALSLDGVNASVARLDRTLLGGALAILALQALVVWFITAFLTRPLTRMTAAARRVAGGELDTTIDEPSGSRETAALAVDLETMLHRLRTTLDSSRRSADDATKARDDMQRFLADAAHELRTPLTALKGYSDLYAGQMLQQPSEVDRAMRRIGSESERMTHLVNNMLQLARDGTVSETPIVSVPVGNVVAGVVDDLRAAFPDLVIDLDKPSGGGPEVRGDPDQLHQAILNIGSNACQHSEGALSVRFVVRTEDDHAVIEVIDHGPGVAPDHTEKIFLPFYRADASRSRNGQVGAGSASQSPSRSSCRITARSPCGRHRAAAQRLWSLFR